MFTIFTKGIMSIKTLFGNIRATAWAQSIVGWNILLARSSTVTACIDVFIYLLLSAPCKKTKSVSSLSPNLVGSRSVHKDSYDRVVYS